MRTKLDLGQLRQEIREMERHQPLFHVLKEELIALGYWQNRPRGNPAAGLRIALSRNPKMAPKSLRGKPTI